MNIFHGDETWQGRWNPENDVLLSFVDDPESFKMSVGNAHWIADQYGEALDAVGAAYPMAQMLVSQELLGHMDGTDEDVFRAIGDSLVPTLTMEDVARVKTVPLSLAQYYLPDLVDEENWVPELDESRAYFQLGQFPLNLPASQHEDRTPGEIEMLGRARWDKSLEQKGTPAPQRNGNLATDIVTSFLGGMTESSVTMMQGPKFFGDKVAEFIPGYEGSFFDKWANSEIAALQWLRESSQDYYATDPEFAQSYAGELTKVLGASVPQILSMTLPPLAATMIGGQSFQYAWEDAENTARRLGQPFNRNRAFVYAFTMGAVNAVMTMMKFDLVVKPWLNTGGRPMVNNAFKLMRTTLLGTVTNVGQGAANDALAWGFGIEPRNPFDPERRKHDALLGAGTSLVLSLGGMTLAPAAEKPAQPPPEKPAVTFDKSIGKQEVPPPVAESTKPDALPQAGDAKELGEISQIKSEGKPKIRVTESLKRTPLGFENHEQFRMAVDELYDILKSSGVKDAVIGCRGSAVTGVSRKTSEPFGEKNDVDIFIVSDSLAARLDVDGRRYEIIFPKRLNKHSPAIRAWSNKWSAILGRPVSAACFYKEFAPTEGIFEYENR